MFESESKKDRLGTIEEISEQIGSGAISPSVLTNELLKRIFDLNPRQNLFITITDQKARSSAKASDDRMRSSRRIGKLDGVPLAIKDNFFIRGVRCTAGSKILSDFFPEYSAPVVERLEQAGSVILGTTNLHEFASGVTTENPHYGIARNPWDPGRITGGSSGGSAASVAAGLACAALGTDTAGSVRIPASLCGVVGLKPTYGLVSTRGTIPLSSSLDHVGVLARTCADAAIVLESIAGYDEQDPGSINAPTKHGYCEEALGARDRIHKIGIPRKYFLDFLDDGVRKAFEIVITRLRSLKFELSEVEIPDAERSEEIWAPIRFSEATAYHESWLRTRPGDYGEDVRLKLERGKEFSAVQYISAKKRASQFRANMIKALERFDAFITPTTPIPAPRIGQTRVSTGSVEKDVYSILVRLTLPFNVTGLPAVSVPMGLSGDGLPFGMQLVGRPFEEGTILGIGSAYERNFGEVGIAPLGS